MLVFPPFRLDTHEGKLWKGETALSLRRKPFAILSYLASRPQKLVTHDELLAQVWRGAVVSDSAMRSHLHELRQVLGEGVIETVIGRGYRFIAELRDDVVVASLPQVAKIEHADPLVVGRDAELEQLRAALARSLGGQRQLCFVTGEPGIGKTTLVRTFVASVDPRAVIVGRGACFEQHGTPEPYLAIIEALGELERSARGSDVRAALARYAPTFAAQLPQLVSEEQLAELTRRAAGGNESRQLRELCEALEALASQHPLVLVLEDLQWSDVATIDLLALLGQRRQPAKLLVIGTSRHAEIQRAEHPLNPVMRSLVARSGALALQVPRIGLAAVQSFVDRRFPAHTFPRPLIEWVAKTTGGTPLYMVSLLDELAGRGMLAERDGSWALTVSLAELQAHRPASVKQLIDMQLDRLSLTEQRILEAGAVVGAEFSTTHVAAALELDVEQVDDLCDALARRSLFLRTEPGDRYGVTHALVQEVCLERSSPARRQRWHRLVAEALERDPRAGELAHLRAQHFEAAGEAERAIAAYAIAARNTMQRHAASDTVALCARALDLLPRLAAGPERDRRELELLTTMSQQITSNSFALAFSAREPQAIYGRAIELARGLGDPSMLYGAITQLCNYQMITAQYVLSAALATDLERLEQQHAIDPGLLHAGIFARGYIAFFSGDLETALRSFGRLVEDPVFRANLPGRALALGHLACVRWVVGEPDRALEEANATIALADELEIPIMQALGHVVRARVRYLRRDPLPVVEQELPHAVRAAWIDVGLLIEANAFALWAAAQRAPLAPADIQPLLDGLRQRLAEVSTCSTLIALALIDVLRASEQVALARELTDEMIGFAKAHEELVYLPELLRVRGAQREASEPAAALSDYREAVALARAKGARSFETRAAEDLAALEGQEKSAARR